RFTLSPLGRGWFASVASKPGEGFYRRIERPGRCSGFVPATRPLTRFTRCAREPPSPQRGEGLRSGWCVEKADELRGFFFNWVSSRFTLSPLGRESEEWLVD